MREVEVKCEDGEEEEEEGLAVVAAFEGSFISYI